MSIEELDIELSTLDFPDGFIFRQGQRETILKIVFAVLEGKTDIILHAPTGTGKSIIALVISKLLNKLKKSGYILTSDLQLQTQYENDIFNTWKLDWGSIKGRDNYNCVQALPVKYSLGHCAVHKIPLSQAKKLPCFENCDYLQKREKSINASTALLNYSYWLIQRTYVASKFETEEEVPFKQRDFVICDEGHKLDMLLFNHFSPRLSSDLQTNLDFLSTNLELNNLSYLSYWHKLNVSEDTEEFAFYLTKIHNILLYYEISGAKWKKGLDKKEELTAIQSSIVRTLDLIKDINCKVDDFVNKIVAEGGSKDIIKTTLQSSTQSELQFYHLNSELYFKHFLHDQCPTRIYMSATWGNTESIKEMYHLNPDKTEIIYLDNFFDYDKSPIILLNKAKRMTYKDKQESFKTNVSLLNAILNHHPDEKGIIHTGSYELTKWTLESFQNNPNSKRLLYYDGSTEKAEALIKFKNTKNSFLIGPSLIEGLNFNDDESRVQIFMKVPYLSLADKFIKEKLNKSQAWYEWKAALNFEQGLGRSVRHQTDHATSYLIDGSFLHFLDKSKEYINQKIYTRLKQL